jgi:hypothetical protein
MFFFPFRREGLLRCDRAAELFGRHEVLLSALYGEHVADHLPGNSQRGAVPMSSLQFSGVDQGEFVRLSGRQLGSLDQHSLDVLVPLLGNRHAHHLVG